MEHRFKTEWQDEKIAELKSENQWLWKRIAELERAIQNTLDPDSVVITFPGNVDKNS